MLHFCLWSNRRRQVQTTSNGKGFKANGGGLGTVCLRILFFASPVCGVSRDQNCSDPAGKTYSLFGPPEALSQLVDDELSDFAQTQLPNACHGLVGEARRAKCGTQGLLPRALQFLFRVLQEMNLEVCSTRATFTEIYNENIYDLFNPSATKRLDVFQRAGSQVGFHVPGLTAVSCSSAIELMRALQQGLSSRHTHGHSASRESSRAHAIFTVEIPLPGKTGRLIFADLAGSERLKRISGADQKETGYINKSLLMLSNCVSALSSNPNSANPPGAFRNSKLTKARGV